MAVVSELIRAEANGTVSFGDYTLPEKAKLDNFANGSNIYKVKTCKDITKLECNDRFVYESVPGTAVFGFAKEQDIVNFEVNGVGDAQVTLELEPETEYEVTIGGESSGVVKTNLGGKLSFGLELGDEVAVTVKVAKK